VSRDRQRFFRRSVPEGRFYASLADRVNKHREKLQSALENALSEEPPPSLHQLAKRLGES
jgi:hypothetical protein